MYSTLLSCLGAKANTEKSSVLELSVLHLERSSDSSSNGR